MYSRKSQRIAALPRALAVWGPAALLVVFLVTTLFGAPLWLTRSADPDLRPGRIRYLGPGERPAWMATAHNCRFWGLVGADYGTSLLHTHLIDGGLTSFRELGAQNMDGWGFAYFVPESYDLPLNRPIYRRGGPPSVDDEDFLYAVDELKAIAPRAIVGHVRQGTSGHWGVPDPHPFQHEGKVFVHNGSVPSSSILDLLEEGNPDYLDDYPPDWVDDHVDSELYFLYLLKYLREHPELSTAEGLRQGVTEVAVVAASKRLNFIMTEGDTLYALRYHNVDSTDPVRFYPTLSVGDPQGYPYWVVSSQKVGSDPNNWETIPEKTLGVFIAGEEPQFLPIDGHDTPLFSFKSVEIESLSDADQDDWMSAFELRLDPDVEWGAASIYFRVLSTGDGEHWTPLLDPSGRVSIYGAEVDTSIHYSFDVAPDTLEADSWDLKIELFDADSPSEPVLVATAPTYPALDDVRVEGTARDTVSDRPPEFEVFWVDRTAEIDQDEDGFMSAFTLRWDVNYGEESDSAEVYMKTRAFDGGSFRNLGVSDVYEVRGAQSDTASFTVVVSPDHLSPRLWNLVLDLYRADNDSLCATVYYFQFDILADVPVEGADEDALFALAAPVQPNPAHSDVVIPLRLPVGGAEVTFEIYDGTGRVVWRTAPEIYEEGGEAQLVWNLTDLQGQPVGSGAYFYSVGIGQRHFQGSFRVVR